MFIGKSYYHYTITSNENGANKTIGTPLQIKIANISGFQILRK